jgi:flagellar protein FliO/FliZ
MDLITAPQLIRFAAALVLVVAMMIGLGLVMRRVNAGSGFVPGQKRRLKIVEVTNLDHRHRLYLIRRDDREHLVILGPTGETVVESGIIPPVNEDKNDATGQK